MAVERGDGRPLWLIGCRASAEDASWPDAQAFVDTGWDADEREQVVDHLQRGFVVRAYLGRSPCRLCGCRTT